MKNYLYGIKRKFDGMTIAAKQSMSDQIRGHFYSWTF